jgi:hypothetical protein
MIAPGKVYWAGFSGNCGIQIGVSWNIQNAEAEMLQFRRLVAKKGSGIGLVSLNHRQQAVFEKFLVEDMGFKLVESAYNGNSRNDIFLYAKSFAQPKYKTPLKKLVNRVFGGSGHIGDT